jgi:DNA polymerase sigma
MLAAFLQTKIFYRQAIDANRPQLGVLFVDFFSFYTEYKMKEIDIKPFGWDHPIDGSPIVYRNKDMINLQITDPLNSSNNVAKSSYQFMQLENLFNFIYFSFFQPNQDSILGNVFESSKLFHYLTLSHNKNF